MGYFLCDKLVAKVKVLGWFLKSVKIKLMSLSKCCIQVGSGPISVFCEKLNACSPDTAGNAVTSEFT